MVPFLFILTSGLSILLLMGVLIRRYLAVVTVENVSMLPTLEPGDRMLVVRHWPNKWLHRGDIVLVWPSRTSPIGPTLLEVKSYIKRVVGLGQETITTSLIERVETVSLHEQDAGNHQHQQVWQIPPGHIFVCGDNRESSLDSRTWGPLPLHSVLGVVLMKLPRKAFSLPSPDSPFFHEVSSVVLVVGQDAPSFTAQSLSGEKVTLATYSKRAVIFVFFAPSDFCREALSECASLVSKAAAAGITMVFVSSTGIQPTRPFVDKLFIEATVLVAPRLSNSFLHDYNISGIPAYCLVNTQGKVQSVGGIGKGWSEWKTLVESWTRSEFPIIDDTHYDDKQYSVHDIRRE